MNILLKINVLRRVLMRKITQSLGDSSSNNDFGSINKENVTRVLVVRPNHRLGNQLLISPLIQEVSSTFPNCKIDLFVKGGLAPVIYLNYPQIDKIIQLPKKHFHHLLQYSKGWLYIKQQHYDIVVNVEKGSSSGNLATQIANSKFRFFGDDQESIKIRNDDYEHAAKKSVYNFRNYLSHGDDIDLKVNIDKPIPPMDMKLSPSELAGGKKILEKLVKNNRETICIFTYATGNKCYSVAWWEKFYEKLQEKFVNHNILEILPVENVSQIDFKAPSFYTREIREMASVMANTSVFIGADSGIMHLASASKLPTVGLFSVTNPEKYKPYNNRSIAINTEAIGQDEILNIVDKILHGSPIKVAPHQ